MKEANTRGSTPELFADPARRGVKSARRVWKALRLDTDCDVSATCSVRTVSESSLLSRRSGRLSNIRFYEVGRGITTTFEYYDDKPIGSLLEAYCETVKASRSKLKFEVWDYAAKDATSITSFRRDHQMQGESIDVSRLG